MNTTFSSLHAPGRFSASVDPATAAALLSTQQPPSKVRSARVAQYSGAMAAGQWVADVATITFDERGALVDGASVLRAVIASEQQITVTVATGVPYATAQYIGLGRGHSLADRIRHEFTHPELVASIVNLQLAYESGVDAIVCPRKAYVPTGVDYARAHHAELEAASVRASAAIVRVQGILPRHLAWVIYRANRIDPADASSFFTRLADGVLLEEGSPVQQLDSYLRRVRNTRDAQRKTVGMLIKAWNMYREGARRRLTFRAGGSSPEALPELR